MLLLAASLTTGCATGSTFRSGVGDRLLEGPPYYSGTVAAPDSVGYFPVRYQRGATQSAVFEPAERANSPVSRLVADMNRYLDSLGWAIKLGDSSDSALPGTPPDVQFGCDPHGLSECEASGDTTLGRNISHRLAVGRPSGEWVAMAAAAMEGAGVARSLVITLEIGHYWIRQSGLRGDKSIELGTGHTIGLPWVTSLESPVPVLQLTGALVGRDGRAIRIGAEGMLARRTSLPAAALGLQAVISDAEVEQLQTLRRNDIAGAPLVWQAALRQLVSSLTGR